MGVPCCCIACYAWVWQFPASLLLAVFAVYAVGSVPGWTIMWPHSSSVVISLLHCGVGFAVQPGFLTSHSQTVVGAPVVDTDLPSLHCRIAQVCLLIPFPYSHCFAVGLVHFILRCLMRQYSFRWAYILLLSGFAILSQEALVYFPVFLITIKNSMYECPVVQEVLGKNA